MHMFMQLCCGTAIELSVYCHLIYGSNTFMPSSSFPWTYSTMQLSLSTTYRGQRHAPHFHPICLLRVCSSPFRWLRPRNHLLTTFGP